MQATQVLPFCKQGQMVGIVQCEYVGRYVVHADHGGDFNVFGLDVIVTGQISDRQDGGCRHIALIGSNDTVAKVGLAVVHHHQVDEIPVHRWVGNGLHYPVSGGGQTAKSSHVCRQGKPKAQFRVTLRRAADLLNQVLDDGRRRVAFDVKVKALQMRGPVSTDERIHAGLTAARKDTVSAPGGNSVAYAGALQGGHVGLRYFLGFQWPPVLLAAFTGRKGQRQCLNACGGLTDGCRDDGRDTSREKSARQRQPSLNGQIDVKVRAEVKVRLVGCPSGFAVVKHPSTGGASDQHKDCQGVSHNAQMDLGHQQTPQIPRGDGTNCFQGWGGGQHASRGYIGQSWIDRWSLP